MTKDSPQGYLEGIESNMSLGSRNQFRKIFFWLIRQPVLNFILQPALALVATYDEHRRQKTIGSSIEKLDQALSPFSNLKEFLASEEGIEQYYLALRSYFSPKPFPRKSFDAILDQVKTLATHIPEFCEIAWREPSNQINFQLETREKNSGRDLNFFLWRIERSAWISNLESKSKKMTVEEATEILEGAQASIEKFESILFTQKLSSKKRRASRMQFYKSLNEDSKLQSVASLILHQYLLSDENAAFFDYKEADLILHYFTELKQNPQLVLLPWVKYQAPILSIIKDLIPSPTYLLSKKNVFFEHKDPNVRAIKGRSGALNTLSVRPFHAIWTGIVSGDCTGGEVKFLPLLTPLRWVTPLLEHSENAFLENNGKYHGYVRSTLVQAKGSVFQNFEVWCSLMARKVIVPNENQNHYYRIPLFDYWFPKWTRNSESNPSRPYVISNSKLVGNTLAKECMWNSKWGKELQIKDDFVFESIDPIVLKIAPHFPKINASQKYYQGNIVLDSTLIDSKEFKVLSFEESTIISSERAG